ncbi:hypothetical protein KWT13_19285 [Clostridioides difficile]|nr:hypothetical protein [Clostridioides difficile]MBF4710562.1 hypothetical protein [Clostridioides difficile]MBY1443969.1 hypothetical protein [Clostridioides difficile]MBY1488960.1 hypothetical protein [Clostridioides difficile]MBY1863125.1 hypothetical protein [Clostridioides difficile]MBZ0592849.1 hypothetical protein [Clostridioides difficile]
MDKFAGIGFINIVLIWLVCSLLSLMFKVIFTKYEVEGLSQVVRAS